MGDEFRRYLQTRISLGEPELVFPDLGRGEARRLAARATRFDLVGPATEGREAAEGEADPSLSPAEVRRLSAEGSLEEITDLPDLSSLEAVVRGCTRCPLHEGRRNAVFGEGSPDAAVLCVGEAPGAREDETGRPFVGPAGKLLDRLLLAVGFRREEVYICNVLKSRPPNNRDPREEEIEACSPYLLRQIELVDPRVIVTFGAFASRTLLDTDGSLGSLRGRLHVYGERPLVATYHPAALLRNRSWTRPAWEDLQLVRRVVDGEAGGEAARQLELV